jgi:hypothetical protein
MTISNPSINGVTSPVRKASPVLSIENDQYTGLISWSSNSVPLDGAFVAETSYTATITIVPKNHYTLTGIGSNFFTHSGANSVLNSFGSGSIAAVFPATNPTPTYTITYSIHPSSDTEVCRESRIDGLNEQSILEGANGISVEAMPITTSGYYDGRTYDGCTWYWYGPEVSVRNKIIQAINVQRNENWFIIFDPKWT